MCGIAVHFSAGGRATPLDLQLIRHRGPDSSGEWTSPDARCWLGGTRLAIVDLSPAGAQPMTDPDTGNVIVVNGEIYNHRALRARLGPEVKWKGTSDTETILRGYARWGREVLDHLKGMFALAIYDAARAELFFARDRVGIKPLYYRMDADGLRAASETRMLVASGSSRLTGESISGYLQWGACPERNLLYEDVHALPAGHAMTIGSQGERRTWRYWPARPAFVSSTKDVVGQVRGLLDQAVDEHLLSDVPVASFLSGGIDSSIITAIAAQKLENKLQTFSVGFDLAEFDETAIAQEIAERYRTDHHRIELSEDEVIHSVTEAVEKLDLPSVDAINTYIVSRAVAAHGVKVALSGLGGDELFGGYPSFRDVPRLKLIAKLPRPLRKVLGVSAKLGDRLADLPSTGNAGELARWRRRFFTDDMIRRAGLPSAPAPFDCPVGLPDDYALVSWAELTGYMRRMLLRDADQMSMAVSLELRVPFLDHELVEFVLGLPAAAKQRYRGTKGLLVEACRDLLPGSVYQRPKAGFVLPMGVWIRGPLASFVDQGIGETTSRQLLPEAFVREVSTGFRDGSLHWTRLWSIVVLGHFAKRRGLSREVGASPMR
ncbi:MAG TPA: asparagine synthase (glutamine-hydrolyzing), partial [Chthoniobacterales bacterium]|nr:asparagine synthase (glutamine-hydrolyzing) [Chthoniobacterales bacterium]